MVDNFGDLYPIYPQTKGVESWDIQRAVNFARSVVDDVPEVVPEEIRDEYDVVDARTAVDLIHAPDTFAQVEVGRRRYRFEEALVTQVVLGRRRAFLRTLGAQARSGGGGLLAAFDERLPFVLTDGQRAVGEVIEADLAQPHPMNRLLQGEVGSGKTVVALRAMLRVVDSGGQAALLAPTEVLAQQHYRSMTAMLGDLAAGGMLGGAADGTTVALLTGSMPKAARAEAMSRMVTGEAGIVIGTHALLEEKVMFADLGLVVVDEQHRFGVEQRAALTDKAGWPPARARDDRDADPAHGGDDGVRRPGGVHAVGAARRPGADPDERRAARRAPRLDRARLGARQGGGREGPPGVRRVPADHRRRAGGGWSRRHRHDGGGVRRHAARPPGRRAAAAQLGHRGGGAAALRAARRAARGDAARPDAARRQGPRDALVRGGRDRRAGVHDRHRGRRRRRQRDHDGAARRRPLRRSRSCTRCAVAWAAVACRACACWSATRRRSRRPANGWTPWPPPPTASS